MADGTTEKFRKIASSTVSGTLWNYASFALSKGLTFISTIILARILAPEDFGLVAMGLVFIGYLEMLNELGVGHALIYHQGDVEEKSNVAFVMSVSVNVFLAVVAVFAAPLASFLFHEPQVIPIIRALSISFILSSLGSIHAARLKKELQFRKVFLPEFGRAAAKGLVSITMALMGFGVWSLVLGQVAGVLISNILYWIVVPWRPRLHFDPKVARSLLGYGSQIILVGIVGMIHKNVDYLIIGNRMDPEQLGFYTMAFRIPDLVILSVCYVVSTTLFPAFSKIQDNLVELRKGYLSSLKYISLLTVPLAIGLYLLSSEIITLFYSEKWSASIPVMQMLCLYTLFYSLSFNAGDIYKAIGKPGILNLIGFFKLAVTIPVIWYTAGISIFAVAVGQAIVIAIFALIELGLVSSIVSIRPTEILHALLPALTGGAGLVIVVGMAYRSMSMFGDLGRLIVIPVIGIMFYAAMLWLIDRGTVLSVIDLLKTERGTS
ncbi:MAG: lipopolysaccharide biosynthesis protein [Anaerolineales bacterium]|nr:lipopolysaccharide biosynthesis protein [Anaerolineales bacterium]